MSVRYILIEKENNESELEKKVNDFNNCIKKYNILKSNKAKDEMKQIGDEISKIDVRFYNQKIRPILNQIK